MIITRQVLKNYFTRVIDAPLRDYFVSLVANLTEFSYLYSSIGVEVSDIHCVRIDSKAFGFTCDGHIYFNITEFDRMCKNKKCYYIASLLVSVFAHESINHDIIDYHFLPPIKEVQDSLDKYYDKKDHARETLPCYFSMALLGHEAATDELYRHNQGLLLNIFFLLRDNIKLNVQRYLNPSF